MTAHEQGARNVLSRWMKDPDTERVLFAARAIQEVSSGRFSDTELGAVMGTGTWHNGAVLPPEQALMVMFTHVDNVAGRIVRTKVRAASTPHRDRFRDKNMAALSELPHPFTAHVDQDQHCGDDDGWLEWHEPVEADVCTSETVTGPDGRPEKVQARTLLAPGRVSLEIGSTLPSRTRLHLASEHGVARWPYGHDWVYVWVAPDGLPQDHLTAIEALVPDIQAATVPAQTSLF